MYAAVASTDPVNDDLWEAIQPLLLPDPAYDHHHRACRIGPHSPASCSSCGTVPRGGDLTEALSYGSGVTCWRRLRQWQALDIWATVHQVVLNWLGDLDAIDWSRASVDGVSVRAKRGGEHAGPNPTVRVRRCRNQTVY